MACSACGRAAFVAGTGVGHHALQFGAAFMQGTAHLQQQLRLGRHAGAVAVGVHFDHHRKAVLVRCAVCHHGLRCGHRVHHHGQCTAAFTQGLYGSQLVRFHAHGVQDVGKPGVKEHGCFLERGYRDAAGARLRLQLATGTHLAVFTCGRSRTPSAARRCCMCCTLCCRRVWSTSAAGVAKSLICMPVMLCRWCGPGTAPQAKGVHADQQQR
jgi:hypothetical protein